MGYGLRIMCYRSGRLLVSSSKYRVSSLGLLNLLYPWSVGHRPHFISVVREPRTTFHEMLKQPYPKK
jgi:hypothetical protein